ncbi:uncharacterized protein RSE6_09942 [Rhynchosporium secalis]|uniref:Uncharacterized protein n=1 Tax=Rhynchosporium secalis TaxID=38038 RepID=A0A1E1MJ77_RHYSE|nr:uncharacterized protein RSE6_09942 [Rhynchosporium secalis]
MSSSSSSYESEASSRRRQDSGVCLEDCGIDELHDPPTILLRYPKSALRDIHQDFALRDRSANIQSAHRDKKHENFKNPLNVTLDIFESKDQAFLSDHPFHITQSESSESDDETFASPADHPLDHINHLALLAKHAAVTDNPDIYAHIGDLADFAIGLAKSLLSAQTSIQTLQNQYENDRALVQNTTLALLSSRNKLEAERSQIQDLSIRLNGIRVNHMTALAKLAVRRAEYEYRADEDFKLKEEHALMRKEIDKMKREREEEILGMATEMWRVKVCVRDMFERNEWSLRDGIRKAEEDIDSSLERLNIVMNASIKSGTWGRSSEDSSLESEDNRKTSHSSDWYSCGAKFCSPNPLHVSHARDWSDMEQYTAGCGARSVDSDERVSEATALVTKEEMEMREFPYWHGGEYDFR